MDEDVLYTELPRYGKQYREDASIESSMLSGAWAILVRRSLTKAAFSPRAALLR